MVRLLSGHATISGLPLRRGISQESRQDGNRGDLCQHGRGVRAHAPARRDRGAQDRRVGRAARASAGAVRRPHGRPAGRARAGLRRPFGAPAVADRAAAGIAPVVAVAFGPAISGGSGGVVPPAHLHEDFPRARQRCQRLRRRASQRRRPRCAKLAIVSIDRSRAALEGLRGTFGVDRIDPLIAILGELTCGLEQRVPDARAFVRPGLDCPVA